MNILDETEIPEHVTYASFGQRLVAFIIDAIILSIINYIVSRIVGAQLIGGFFSIVIQWIYFAYQESSEKQATIGKITMGIKVVDMEGYQISFAKATGRHFGKIVSGLILLIGYFMMLFSDKNQTLHDQMAGCLVIEGQS